MRKRLAVGMTVLLFTPGLACSSDPRDAFVDCGALSQFHENGLGCFNTIATALGQVYAVSVDGKSPPVNLEAYALTADPDGGAPGSVMCQTALADAISSHAEPGQNYSLTPSSFDLSASANVEGVSAQLSADIAKSFTIQTTGQTLLTLDDPEGVLSCSPGAMLAIDQYWKSLTPAEQADTAIFVVTQVIDTAITVKASNGASLHGSVNYQESGGSVSVTISCNELEQLTENDSGNAPVFFDGKTFRYDGNGQMTLTSPGASCNALLAQ